MATADLPEVFSGQQATLYSPNMVDCTPKPLGLFETFDPFTVTAAFHSK